MPRGAPDYSNVRVTNPLHRMDDMAELAARLGSPITHDRAGSVVFMDSFMYGLSDWQTALSGTGASVALVSLPYRTGPFSVKLVAGSDSSRQAKIFRKFPYPVLGKYGLEASWKPEAHTDQFIMKLIRHDGAYDREFACYYDLDALQLKIRDSDGTYVVVASDLYLGYQYAPFHTFKIVGDFDTNEYVRLIVNEGTYDVSDYSAYPHATDDGLNVRADIYISGDEGYNGFSYVDDIILTQAEP